MTFGYIKIFQGLSSYSIIPGITPSTEGALNVICERLYVQHGKLLTQMILGLISIPRHGFSEQNLIDIISGEEEVLNDVFQYHQPPISRVPNINYICLFLYPLLGTGTQILTKVFVCLYPLIGNVVQIVIT